MSTRNEVIIHLLQILKFSWKLFLFFESLIEMEYADFQSLVSVSLIFRFRLTDAKAFIGLDATR